MEHIIKRHMIPVPKKKSYFLSRDVTYVTKLVKQTIFHPSRLVTQYAFKWLKLNWLIELIELWLKWLKRLYKEEGKARKMDHIVRRHMIPVPEKKSYFLSRDVTYVTKLVKQTIFHPTRRVTHKSHCFEILGFFDIFTVTPLLFWCNLMELRKPRRAERLHSSPFFVLAST